MENRKYYISGPMTGLPNFNHTIFNRIAKELRAMGLNVFNPAETDEGSIDKDRKYYLRKDIEELLKCTHVVLLDGWKKSKGALLEVAIAKELNMTICNTDLTPYQDETICQEADYLVSEDRGSDYGTPRSDFTRTGRIWGAILGIPDVPPEKVGLCMIGVKISRETHKHKKDNLIDVCGYSKTIAMINEDK